MREISHLESELQNVLDRRSEVYDLLQSTQAEITQLNSTLSLRKDALRRAVAEASVFPILGLPDPVILRVMSFVGPRELGRLSRTCRRLERLVHENPGLWERHSSPTSIAVPIPIPGAALCSSPTRTWSRTTPRERLRFEDCPFPRAEIKRRTGPLLGIPTLKVNLVGACNSCLLKALEGQPFDRNPWTGTLGINYKAFAYEEDGVGFALHLWDMSGDEKFPAITAPFYRATKGIVLCYALDSRPTFERIHEFVAGIDQFFPNPQSSSSGRPFLCSRATQDPAPSTTMGTTTTTTSTAAASTRPKLFLLGCKSDTPRVVSTDEARTLSRSLGAIFLGETSSATRNHIDDAFLCVAHHIFRKCNKDRPSP